jgi:hypothetical protein
MTDRPLRNATLRNATGKSLNPRMHPLAPPPSVAIENTVRRRVSRNATTHKATSALQRRHPPRPFAFVHNTTVIGSESVSHMAGPAVFGTSALSCRPSLAGPNYQPQCRKPRNPRRLVCNHVRAVQIYRTRSINSRRRQNTDARSYPPCS